MNGKVHLKSNCSNLTLLIVVLLWLSNIPAFENSLWTGAELDGTESNCKASLDRSVSFLSDQNAIGFISIVGLSRYACNSTSTSLYKLVEVSDWELVLKSNNRHLFAPLALRSFATAVTVVTGNGSEMGSRDLMCCLTEVDENTKNLLGLVLSVNVGQELWHFGEYWNQVGKKNAVVVHLISFHTEHWLLVLLYPYLWVHSCNDWVHFQNEFVRFPTYVVEELLWKTSYNGSMSSDKHNEQCNPWNSGHLGLS